MEYAEGEALHAHLKAQPDRKMPEDKIKIVMRQLIGAIAYLHENQITHRDIKLDNIIIDKRGCIKLIDFGFCCVAHDDTLLTMYCGTPSYMSPEIAMKKPYYGQPTDIWASGILCYALLCG